MAFRHEALTPWVDKFHSSLTLLPRFVTRHRLGQSLSFLLFFYFHKVSSGFPHVIRMPQNAPSHYISVWLVDIAKV